MAEGGAEPARRPSRRDRHVRDATPRRRRARSSLGLVTVVVFTALVVALLVALVILVLVVAANRAIG